MQGLYRIVQQTGTRWQLNDSLSHRCSAALWLLRSLHCMTTPLTVTRPIFRCPNSLNSVHNITQCHCTVNIWVVPKWNDGHVESWFPLTHALVASGTTWVKTVIIESAIVAVKRNPYAQEHIIQFCSFLYETTYDSKVKPQKELHVCNHKKTTQEHSTVTTYNQALTLAVVPCIWKKSFIKLFQLLWHT